MNTTEIINTILQEAAKLQTGFQTDIQNASDREALLLGAQGFGVTLLQERLIHVLTGTGESV